ncbi:hypothetical protein CICLE_v10011022mg [Citrus x clementina]|uniref:DUF4378 domain-containing protein n=3 Tax=Citrus clementina TaxID=85681 RepID=V4STD7_CITCL|nr:hypothetical protein CICLE_v10011022mg [Citrus x clementina]
MSRETESKRRSPSVIARLMGFDGLPATQAAHKQHKRSAENNQPWTASAEKAQRSTTSSGRRSFRKSSKEEQEFKDVFEVLDASKMETCSKQESTNSKLSEAEMVFIRQKFMEAKRLSTDERFQDSKEFQDALEVLDSNKDLLLKFLQQPDSLFTKHLHDLGASSQSHCGHISAMTPSLARQCESSDVGWKAERGTQCKNQRKSSQEHPDGLSRHSSSGHAAQSLNKPAIVQLEGKEDHSVLPTRIVVLKPNVGRVQAAARTVSSPRSSHGYPSDSRKHTELPGPGMENREPETWEKKKFPDDVGFSRHKSRESRELAKEITRQMRDNLSSVSMKFSSTGFKGYAGDESSSNFSGNESANELEIKTMTSKDGFIRHRRSRSSSSHSSESSVSREAKKRLSERWKMSHKSQELGVINRGNTLGEMLAMSDREVRPANVDTLIGQEGFCDRRDGNNGPTRWVEPLGISSRDGWKDGRISTLTRSRSLPTSSTLASPKTSMRYESLRDDRYIIPKETIKRERGKAVKGNFNQREGSSSRSSKASRRKYLSSQCTSRESNITSPDTHFTLNQVESNIKEYDPSEESFMVLESSPSIVMETNSVLENVLHVEHDNTIISSRLPNPEFSSPLLLNADSSTGDLDISSSKEPSAGSSKEVPLHQTISEIESPARSKEADQPSPVSILEAPFVDDLSCGSEYFESVSADLHGLRMQLQLLKLDKLESEAFTEGTMHISSDEDEEERSVGVTDEKSILKAEENWEHSYVADILIHSGIKDVNPEMFVTTCYSPECPVSPSVFEELEKKYSNLNSLPRSERKLLFDCINAQLLEIHQRFIDPLPWVRTTIRVKPKWNENGLLDNLRTFLISKHKKVDKDAGENVLARELQWLDTADDIDVIGKEIEILLIDELVADVVAT